MSARQKTAWVFGVLLMTLGIEALEYFGIHSSYLVGGIVLGRVLVEMES